MRAENVHLAARATHWACGVLAASFTLLSLALSACAGWARGDSSETAVFWVGCGILTVLAAHLLVAVSTFGGWAIRIAAWALWGLAMTLAVASHASYYLASQQALGEQRETAVRPPPTSDSRPLSRIMADRAKLAAEMAALSGRACLPDCSGVRQRLAALQGRVDALDQEARERRQNDSDIQAYWDARKLVKVDPLIASLSQAWNVPAALLQQAWALLLGLLIDGTACVLWVQFFSDRATRRRRPFIAGESAREASGQSIATVVTGAASNDDRELPTIPTDHAGKDAKLLQLVTKAREGIQAGETRVTVTALRLYLRCGQGYASEVRRALLEAPVTQALCGDGAR